ncbi:hypothetical protein K501DRAFT_282251 [Backusella circina FSU 941]|nr:hypothetical protein K501DRAFT_282251 [Backusella circina FSU 941]
MVTDETNHTNNHLENHPKTTSISDDDDDNMTLENISIKSREVSLSDDTESITLSTGEHTKDMLDYDDEEEEVDGSIHKPEYQEELLQSSDEEEEEEEERDEQEGDSEEEEGDGRPNYKRMDLKGESESDKDLIIYSLNESLQIHKEIVERIQHEKDDLEEKYERERIHEKLELQRETLDIEDKQSEKKQELGKLEGIYQSLLNELELKKQDYKRMENKFQDYVKSIRATEDDLQTIRPEINQLLSQINNLCMSIKSKLVDHHRVSATNAFLELWPEKADLIKTHFKSEKEEENSDEEFELDSAILSLMTEKMMIDIIVQDILKTPIHPGVPINEAFENIHAWVDKRNTSWAARMKQQISAFVIRGQPTDEQVDKAKDDIVNKIMTQLDCVYPDLEHNKVQKKVVSIVNKAAKLNLSIKCQEIPIEILPIEEGVPFDERLMKSVMRTPQDATVSLMVSPLFVAKDPNNDDEDHGFVIPSKVYCA